MDNETKYLMQAFAIRANMSSEEEIIDNIKKACGNYKEASTEESKEDAKRDLRINARLLIMKDEGWTPEYVSNKIDEADAAFNMLDNYKKQSKNN